MKSNDKLPKNSVSSDIKLEYPLYQIGKNLYQEYKPGKLNPWSLQYAILKYGKPVTSMINYHIGFTCEPNHINYQSIIDDHYNKYVKLSHLPKSGDWKTIESLIRHIFGEKDYLMGLEYFWNLYINPKQNLPFLGLVSEKKGTGKSTFIGFMQELFEENVAVVNSTDFKGNFNERIIKSLLLVSDEHTEGKDRDLISQRIKMYITENKIRVEEKFQVAYTAEVFFKIIFAGNNEDMLTIIEPENTRYWIIKVNPLKKADIDFIMKLKKEIPAFLYYLANEFRARKSRGRLYFDPKEFQTKAAALIQKNSRPKLQKKIEEHIIDFFEQHEDIDTLYFTPKDFQKELKHNDLNEIRDILKNSMKLKPFENSIYYEPGTERTPKTTGRPYEFRRIDFIFNETDKINITSTSNNGTMSEEHIELIKQEWNNANN